MYPFSFSKHAAALYAALILAVFCAGVWGVVYAETPHLSGVLTFAVLNVGQGDALYIESPTGVQLLVDGGPDDSLLRELPVVMPALDRSVDVVIATHPDADHIGGFSDLLDRYEVGVFISPGIYKDTATAKTLETKVDEKQILRVVARRGMLLDLGGGAMLQILYPDRDVSVLPGNRANEGCIVAKLIYKDTSALLTCDAPATTEARLLQIVRGELASDILKVPHHGSKYSSTEPFIAAAHPAIAVISVGKNSYGHPTGQTLDRLTARDIEILRTDQEGTIVFRSDGVTFSRDQ